MIHRRIVLAAGLLLACGSSHRATVKHAEPSYIRASPIIEYGPPSVEPAFAAGSGSGDGADGEDEATDATRTGAASVVPPEPDDTDELVDEAAQTEPPRAPAARSSSAILAEANASATQGPDAEAFLNGIVTYMFSPGIIFKVITAPDNSTALLLEPGEEIRGQPVGGDILRWRLAVTSSTLDGVPQQQVFIKPTRAGLATNLAVPTNRRTYFVKLESVDADFMTAVQWTYPHTPAAALPAPIHPPTPVPAAAGTPGDAARLNFDYAVEVVDGRPRWKPRVIYDDARQTFIRFDPSVLQGEVPALYVIERDEMQLVNYRVKGDLYIVDRLFEEAELRLGQDDQDVIRIRNRRRARSDAAPSTSSAWRRGPSR